jgi:serine/threonine protein kinase
MRETIFKAGETCGAFCILSLVGRGGAAEVYKAVHSATQNVVALKCRRLSDISESYVVDHLLAEAELLSRLRHDNIVHVEDVGIDNGVLWMAMEFLSGETLRVVMRKSGPLPLRTALYYAREIAEGVAALHKKCVVHRDLKPENVLVTEQNKVKVLDTGAAKFFGKDLKRTKAGSVFGTPLYMSPEHLRDQLIDPRADVYSLGMMLYEMIAGAHPFTREDDGALATYEIIQRQLRLDPPPLERVAPGVPSSVSDFVKKTIAKNRDLRPSTMAEFADEAGAMLAAIVAESQAILSIPEIMLDASPRLHAIVPMNPPPGAGNQPAGDPRDATDDNAPTIALTRPPAPPFQEVPAPPLPPPVVAAEITSVSAVLPPPPVSDEMDYLQTVPLWAQRAPQVEAPPPSGVPAMPPSSEHFRDTQRSEQSVGSYGPHPSYCATSIPEPIGLQSGWIPVSTRQPALVSDRPSSLRHYAPVVVGALMMAASLSFFFLRPAFGRQGASVMEAAPLVNVPALVQHRSHSGAFEERESLGELSRAARGPRALTPPAGSAGAEVGTEFLRKQECTAPRARKDEGSFGADKLAGPRHYPGYEPPVAPRKPPPAYTPTGI